MNETIKLGITLMIINLVASLALAFTNQFTGPQIIRQKELAIKESLNRVINADSFSEKDGYYEAYDKDGKLVGRVLKIEAPGYSSVINAMVGIDLENKLTGIQITSQRETPGLGSNIEKEDFLRQFIGKTMDSLKIKKDGGSIDAVTGATISSRAISDGVIEAMDKYYYDGKTGVSANYTQTGITKNATNQ